MINKHSQSLNRQNRIRSKLRSFKLLSDPIRLRLSIYRSNKNIGAQIIDDNKKITLFSASSKELSQKQVKGKTKTQQAAMVGKLIAQKAILKKISHVFLDRGSYKFHGRVKALSQAARKYGLKF